MEQSSSIFNFKTFRSPVIILSLYFLLEIGFRISSFGFHTALNWHKYNPQGILVTDIVMPVEDPSISWKLRPNVKTTFKAQKFTTNSMGLRNPEVILEKPDSVKRVIVLGRSITMGAGVADDEVYARVLQNQLTLWQPGAYEVINCAVGGYSLSQMISYYNTYISKLKPDFVLIPLSKEDLNNAAMPVPPLTQAKPSITNLKYYMNFTFLSEALKFVVKRVTNNRISTDWKQRAVQIGRPKIDTISNKAILAEFIKNRSAENIYCFLFSPNRSESGTSNSDDDLKTWTESGTEAGFLEVNDYIQVHMPRKTHIYFGDNHPSAEVHALFADALFNQMQTWDMKN